MNRYWTLAFTILVILAVYLLLEWIGSWDVVYPSIKETFDKVGKAIQGYFQSFGQ